MRISCGWRRSWHRSRCGDLEKVRDQTVLYLPGPWPIGSRPDDFRRSQELAAAAYGLSIEWLSELRIEGPGRYGKAPSDFLAKPN